MILAMRTGEERATIFRGQNRVDKDFCERLWHARECQNIIITFSCGEFECHEGNAYRNRADPGPQPMYLLGLK